jgi:hypothetical protein
MNDELILKKRSEALQSLIKADDLQELASLSEIIATEARFFEILQISGLNSHSSHLQVIKYKPGTDCYTFIYQLLQAMEKTQDAMGQFFLNREAKRIQN